MALSDEERKARHREANRRWRAKAGVREREQEQSSAWKKANPEKVRKYATDRYWRDPERIREANRLNGRARRLASPKVREWAKRYQLENRERINEARRAAYAESSARRLEENAQRRARMRGAPVVERIDREAIIKRDRALCHLCGKRVPKKEIQLDHIVPLSRGGEHVAANVAVAHASCNVSKGARAANDQLRLVG